MMQVLPVMALLQQVRPELVNAEVQAGFFLSLGSILFPRAWPEPPHYNRDEAPWSSLGSPEAVIHSSRDRLGCREAVGRTEYSNRATGSTRNLVHYFSLQQKGSFLLSPLW